MAQPVRLPATNKSLKKLQREAEYLASFKAQSIEAKARAESRQAKKVARRAADPVRTMWQCIAEYARTWALQQRYSNEFWNREDTDEVREILNANIS